MDYHGGSVSTTAICEVNLALIFAGDGTMYFEIEI